MGDTGSTLWYTSTAPVYANSKYTFTISNLSGRTGLDVEVNDIIFYSTYYYIVSAVNTSTVDCTTRVSIKGSDASVTIQTAWGSTLSDSKVPSEKLVKNNLDGKSNTGHTHTVSVDAKDNEYIRKLLEDTKKEYEDELDIITDSKIFPMVKVGLMLRF